MPAELAMQARFTIPSGDMVNTFHFADASRTYDELRAASVAAVTLFYNANVGGSGSSIGGLMAGWVDRPYELRTYDMTTAPPRVPTIHSVTLPNASSVSTSWRVPMDVAVCLSTHGATPLTRRRKGRIYLGGAQVEWFTSGAAGGTPVAVSSAFSLSVRQAALILRDAAVGWSIRSSVPVPNYVPIVGGFVDSEPDTQRRRGMDTTTKVAWGT